MSYILDALRKAERERNAGQVPDLQVASRGEPSTSRLALTRQWLTLGAAIFVGLCIGIALWLRPAHAPEAAAPVVAVAAPAPVVTPPAPEPAPEIAADAIEPGAARLDDLLDKSSDSALSLEEQKKLSAAAVPSAAAVKPVEPPAVAEAPPPAQPTLAEQATAEPELPPELKKLKDMPADYRNGFPPIRVDVHAYDEQPARRFVMINGRKYREGEVMADGPRVVSIEEDGIVFNYRNEDVLYPIAR